MTGTLQNEEKFPSLSHVLQSGISLRSNAVFTSNTHKLISSTDKSLLEIAFSSWFLHLRMLLSNDSRLKFLSQSPHSAHISLYQVCQETTGAHTLHKASAKALDTFYPICGRVCCCHDAVFVSGGALLLLSSLAVSIVWYSKTPFKTACTTAAMRFNLSCNTVSVQVESCPDLMIMQTFSYILITKLETRNHPPKSSFFGPWLFSMSHRLSQNLM